MIEVARAVPNAQALLALAPEELAGNMLFAMRNRGGNPTYSLSSGHGKQFILNNVEMDIRNANPPVYPGQYLDEVILAFAEAWAWLEAQGLLVPANGGSGQQGWRVLSRRARRMESAAQFADFRIARLLPKEILHTRIADAVWGTFMRGEYDVAAFQAMKGVEVAVRDAAGVANELIGVKLMRAAFAPESGPLTDMTVEGGERVGRMELFAGAIASYKNPHSHRDVNLDNAHEALEIIFLANHLLRIVDARAQASQLARQ